MPVTSRTAASARGTRRASTCRITGSGSCRASSRTARGRCRITTASGPISATRGRAGGRVALQGRILAPALPGLYWLQWDMVEEGVTWFAQVAPRQPRTLVVVVPPPAWIVRAAAAAGRAVGTVRALRRRVGAADRWSRESWPMRCLVVRRDAGDQTADPRARRAARADGGRLLADPRGRGPRAACSAC